MSDIINIKKIFVEYVENHDPVLCAKITLVGFEEPISYCFLPIQYTKKQYEQFLDKINIEIDSHAVYITIWSENGWSEWWEDEFMFDEGGFSYHELPAIPKECVPSHLKHRKVWV